MVGVEQWAEIRRLHFVKGLSQREIRRRTGLHRDTIRRAIDSSEPPVYRRAPAGSKLDPFKDEIHRLLREDPKLPGVRVRELLEPLGCTASQDGRRRLPARGAAAVRAAAADVSADGLSAGRDLPVRRLAAARGGPGRPRPDASRLGRHRVSGLLARGRRRAGLLDADRGPAGRDRRLPGAPRRAAADAGLGPPGGHPRPRRPAVGGVRRVLRPAAGRLALLRAGRPAGQGRRRAAAGLRGDELRARPRASPTSSTSRTSSTPGSRRSTRARTRRCARGRSIASPTSWR